MSENKTPSDVDRLVGGRMRWRRREMGFSQERLGELLGLTFQQIQKYERGVNRISAGRLFEMAHVMNVPISYFYEGASELTSSRNRALAEVDTPVPNAGLITSDVMELVSIYQSLPTDRLRKRVIDVLKAMKDASAFDPSEKTT
jgi:transcriptional regulator with XRE-family HTH domain